MKIVLAESAGFCYGVRRAVELAEETARAEKNSVMLGYIIHNKDMIDHLEGLGMSCVEELEAVPAGSTVIVRSHGESRAVHEALAQRGAIIRDATCPNVTRIHKIVSEAEQRGRIPVIIGTPDHPEVTAIAGWCERPVVLSGEEELAKWLEKDPNNRDLPLTFVSQTSSTRKIWDSSVKKSKKRVYKHRIF